MKLNRLDFLFITTLAAKHGYQSPLLAIKLLFMPDDPFVKAVLTHAAFVFLGFLFFGFCEGGDVVGHVFSLARMTYLKNMVGPPGLEPGTNRL